MINKGFKSLYLVFAGVCFLLLSACDQSQSPKNVADDFWQAVQKRDMEQAKILSTWDTVDYLKYLKSEKIHPKRFELGEEMVGESNAEVVTTLYSSEHGQTGVKVPGKTLLVKTEHGWRVNVKKTLGSVVSHTVDNVFDQLNGLMQEGIQELDKSLSKSLNEIGEALEDGANELKKELSKPLFPPSGKTAPKQPQGRQI